MNPSIKLQIEDFQEVAGELAPLLYDHITEVEDKILPFNPDFKSYFVAQRQGKVLLVVARNESDQIVGYCLDYLINNPHYQEMFAINDFIYVHPEYRGDGVFKAMTQYIEEVETDFQVRCRTFNTKVDMTGPLGYHSVEVVHKKHLTSEGGYSWQ